MGVFDALMGKDYKFDPEMWTRVLRASMYIAAAQTADTESAMKFADESTEVIVDAMRKLVPIGAKANVSYEYIMVMGFDLVAHNAEQFLAAVQKSSEAAAEAVRLDREDLQ